MALTEKRIRTAKAQGGKLKLSDGDGLYLYVSVSGMKSWTYRFKWQGKDTTVVFGQYPGMSLREARDRRDELSRAVESGRDPRVQDEPMRTLLFRDVAEEWFRGKKRGWRDSYIESIRQKFTANLFPAFGEIPIDQMTGPTILKELRKIEARGAIATAKRNLTLLHQIMSYALVSQYIESDPTHGLIVGLQATPKVEHFAAATRREDASFVIRAVRNYQGAVVIRLALEFLMLTFVRPYNVRHARWEEIDFDRKVWSIPATMMKTDVEHRVPLSRQALNILHQVEVFRDSEGYVFPPVRRQKHAVLSENAFVNALRIAGVGPDMMTAHGFRSMASSLLNEAGAYPDIIEKQLAHSGSDSIRAIYNRTEYWDDRVKLMQEWADMVDDLEHMTQVA